MTGALRPRILLAVVSAPLLTLAIGWLVAGRGDPPPAQLEHALDLDTRALQDNVRALLDEALRSAEQARMPGATVRVRGPLAARLEGTALLDPDGNLVSWSGTPTDPTRPIPGTPTDPVWSVRVQGLWTRLLALTAADGTGRRGLASFLLDGPAPGQRFVDLLERLPGKSLLVSVELIDAADSGEELTGALGTTQGVSPRAGSPARFVPLAPPRGDLLGIATLRPLPARQQREHTREMARALAALLCASLLPWVARWPLVNRRAAGWIATLAVIGVARAGLLLARVPALLFPRELGTPTFYGGTEAWGLLGCPADLLLTALALVAAGAATLRFARTLALARPIAGRAIAITAALAASEALRRLSISVAVDARVPLLHAGDASRSAAELALLAGLALVLAAAAALWSVGSSARAAALAVVPLAALSALTFLHASDRLAVDRLRSDLEPQIVEQDPRRRLALTASVRAAAASDRAAAAVLAGPGESEFAAYLLWASGDLFHSGYESSLTLYDADGAQTSHFGFDLPTLRESVPVPPALESVPALPSEELDPLVREESFREGSITRRLLHAELPIFDEGRPVGIVVGHVLDEPDNLPFLPGSLPYLAALGFGGPGADPERAEDAPSYVLYDGDGSVLLSTLAQPPAPTARIRAAAAAGRIIRRRAGDERFLGLPLADGERLHLLLLPDATHLDRFGVFLRVCLLGLAGVGAAALLRSWRSRAAQRAARGVTGSFYRKLLVALLVASVLPVLGLSFFVRSYVERRAQSALVESAARLATVVRRVVEDYAAPDAGDPASAPAMNDEVLHWLRRVVGQEINLYEAGLLTASSKRELFASGLLPPRLPGEADRAIVREGRAAVVLDTRLGTATIPVAYTRVHLAGPPAREAVAAVPLVFERRELARAVGRVREMLLLASVILIALLAATAALLARTVAQPVRELAAATRRIAGGDYATRLVARTHDEVAELVAGFNAMAAALTAQRADLERRRDYIEALLQHATAGVVSTDPSGRVVTLNPAAARLLSNGTAAPASGDDLVAAVERNPALLPLAAALRQAPTGAGDPEDVDLLDDGKLRRLRLVRVPLPDPAGGAPGRLLLVDDVTDLVRSNQLAAWAEMARAIAHEIKNPLTPIRLSTEHLERLLRDRGALPAPAIEACIETILKQVASLREIASEFSAYAKLPDLVLVPTDAAQLLRDTLDPYRAALPPGVVLAERYDDAPVVSVDRRVLSRAVVNLIENALHAMAAGGTLTVRLGYAPTAREVTLAVADTGPGLDPAVRSRLFEPYFSTKSAGTGLGLAIVRRAVEAHRGRVEVESGDGPGTEFRLVLPAS